MSNWKGTAVPNTGIIEKVYFNTNLSNEEVISLLSQLTYIEGINMTYLLTKVDNTFNLVVLHTEGGYALGGVDDTNSEIYYWADETLAPMMGISAGWQPFDNPIEVNGEVASVSENIEIGSQNDLISSLFSITPFTQDEPITNLPEFLTGIADAIREVKGSTEKINAQNYKPEILKFKELIGSGGDPEWDGDYSEEGELPKPEGTLEITENGEYDVTDKAYVNINIKEPTEPVEPTSYKVRYFDVDGTLLKEEDVEPNGKTTPPDNPSYDPDYLIFDCWNYDTETYIVDRDTDIGALYKTVDDVTYIFLDIQDGMNLTIKLDIAYRTSIDWGDGTTTESFTNTQFSHTYESIGQYIIKVYGENQLLGSGGGGLLRGGTIQSIQKVYVRKGISKISGFAFYGLKGLKILSIPSSLTYTGQSLCLDCFSLKCLILPNAPIDGEKLCANCYNLIVACVPDLSELYSSFTNCRSLEKFIIPKRITVIDYDSFRECYSLNKVIVHNEITAIGSVAFQKCCSLKEIYIPNGVTRIDNSAFDSCYSLTEIVIPDSVETLDTYVFSNCSSLRNITIPNNITSIKAGLFQNCDSLVNVTLPANIDVIDTRAFYNCKSLVNIRFGDGLKTIGKESFYNCYSLKDVNFPSSLTDIGEKAFYGCNTFKKIIVPENVVSIGTNAFSYCKSLKEAILPDSLTTTSSLFIDCYSLSSVKLGCNLTSLSSFSGCSSLIDIVIPDSVETLGNSCFYGCSIQNYTLPKSLKEIGNSCFSNNPLLTTITIPENVISIGSSAFNSGYLKNVFVECVNVPALQTNSFPSSFTTNGVFWVKDDIIEELKVATNWSVYADIMKPKSWYPSLTDPSLMEE